MIYFFTIVSSVILAYISTKFKSDSKNGKVLKFFFIFLAFLIPFLVSGLRSIVVGTDTKETYYNIYVRALNNLSGARDVGYFIFNRICVLVVKDYQFVIVMTSLLFVGLSFYHIFKESEHPYYSVLLFFATNVFFLSMNMIRQSIAIMIFVFGISAIREKKFLKYLIICLIAFSFHSAAIIYLPLYFICKKDFNIKRALVFLIIIVLFGSLLSEFLLNVLSKEAFFRTYFAWYIGSTYNTGNVSIISLAIAIIIFITLCYCKRFNQDNKNFNIIITMQYIALILLTFSSLIPMMQRTAMLFSFPLFIYLPDIIKNTKKDFAGVILRLGVPVGYLLYMYFTIFIYGYNEVFPYISMFE